MEIEIEPGENGIAPIGCIYFLEQAFRPIVVGYRQGILSELREPAIESIVGIIVAPCQFASASWTRRIGGDVMKAFVEDRSALRARQAADHPLTKLPNVTLSAHSAFRTPEASENLMRAAWEHCRRIVKGK